MSEDKMKILCFGDSNTYGYDPRSYFGGRYPAESRWTDILAELSGWTVLNRGQNGRMIPRSPHELEQAVRMIRANKPDLLLVMLGTNDLLQGADASESCARMAAFLNDILPHCKAVMLAAPPAMKRGEWVTEESLITASMEMAKEFEILSRSLSICFADGSRWNVELTFDGVHFSEAGHNTFAERIYRAITGGESGCRGIWKKP